MRRLRGSDVGDLLAPIHKSIGAYEMESAAAQLIDVIENSRRREKQ